PFGKNGHRQRFRERRRKQPLVPGTPTWYQSEESPAYGAHGWIRRRFSPRRSLFEHLLAVLTPPRKQRRGEIRGRAALARRTGGEGPRIGIRRNHLAIEMPGGMAEQRDNDRKPEEQRQRSQEQQHRHDQAPSSHRNGVSRHDTQRGHHGIPGASMTVEHQR